MANVETKLIGIRRSEYGNFETNRDGFNIVLDWYKMPENGWITSFGVHAGGSGGSGNGAAVLYDGDTKRLLAHSAREDWNTVLRDRIKDFGTHGAELAVQSGKELMFGLWGHPQDFHKFAVVTGDSKHRRYRETGGTIPDRIEGYELFGGRLGAWIEYVEQRWPDQGEWIDKPEGFTTDLTPDFKGTLPQDAREGGRDWPEVVQLRIYDETDSKMVFDQRRETTAWEKNNERFTWEAPFRHEPGHSYWAEFRGRDSWGAWQKGDFGQRAFYHTGQGPDKAKQTFPTEGAIVRTLDPRYTGSYTHPNGLASGGVQVQIWNAAQTILLQDTGFLSHTGTDYAKDSLNSSLKALEWNRGYVSRVRFRDSSLVPGPWSAVSFRTNAPPLPPDDLDPADGIVTPRTRFSVRVRDKDGDQIQWVKFRLTDNTTNTLVRNASQLTGPFDSGEVVSRDFVADLVLSHRYTWEAWSFDGTLESEKSVQETFTYDAVPEVTSLAPQAGLIVNEVLNSSFEYADEAGVVRSWELGDVSAAVTITRLLTDDTGTGSYCMLFERTSAETPGGHLASNFIAVDGGKPLLAYSKLKKISGTPDAEVSVKAYNAEGNVLGTIIPTEINGGLAGQDFPSYWQEYGGYVSQSRLPTGTTHVRLLIQPSISGTAAVQVDDAMVVEIPTAGDTAETVAWYGYFDGGTMLYGEDGDYAWTGDEGLSRSTGLNILTNPSTNVQIDYKNASGAAKVEDRLVIQRYKGGVWESHHDSGWISTARTTIPISSSVIKNEAHYRLQVEARSSAGLIGRTRWITFDALYDGPPELNIHQVAADHQRAELVISWEQTDLDPLEFVAFEIVVEDAAGAETFIERIPDPLRTSAIYRYPISGAEYTVKARQIQTVGAIQLEGRWSGGKTSVDFSPHFVVKDLENPDLMLFFEPERGNLPSAASNDPSDEYMPLLATKPSHVIGTLRYRNSAFEAVLFDDPLLPQSKEYYRAIAVAQEYGGRKACVLGQAPESKHFVVLRTMQHGTNEFLEPTVSVEWSETTFYEDIYQRERTNG